MVISKQTLMLQLSAFCISIALFTGCGSSEKNSSTDKELELIKKELELSKKELDLKNKEESTDKDNSEEKTVSAEPRRKKVSKEVKDDDAFYIVNVAAIKSENDAKKKVKELKNQGYDADYLWIPDYASLSGALFYTVYIGPFYSQYDCEVATEDYRRENPNAYGLKVSQENQRVQINGIGKVTKSRSH